MRSTAMIVYTTKYAATVRMTVVTSKRLRSMGSGWTIQIIVHFTVIYVAIVEILVIGHIDIARTAAQRTEWTVRVNEIS